jgi:hypothetical protein
VGGHQPADDQRPRSPRPPRCARRPAARTGARTSPSATTPTGRPLRRRSGRRAADHLPPVPGHRRRLTAVPAGGGLMSEYVDRIVALPTTSSRPPLLDELADAGSTPSRSTPTWSGDRRGPPRRRRHQLGHDPRLGHGVADFVAREDGVVAGLGDRRAGLPLRARQRGRGERPGRRRHHVAKGDVVMTRHRWDGAAADRGAHRPQLRLPPLRRRHRDGRLGLRARGHSRPGARHPQDAPGFRSWRSTPCAAAAASTTGSACPTRPWSRTTTCSPPAASCRRTSRARATRTCPCRSR